MFSRLLRSYLWVAISCSVFMPGCACDTIHYNSKIRVSNASDVSANVAVELRLYDLDKYGNEYLIATTTAEVPQTYPAHAAGEQSIHVDLKFDTYDVGSHGARLKCRMAIQFGGPPVVSKEFLVGNIPQGNKNHEFSKDFRINIEPAGKVNFYEVAPSRTGNHHLGGGILMPVRIVVQDTAQAVMKALPQGLLP